MSTAINPNDYFGRLANKLYFKTPKVAVRSLSDELHRAVAEYDEKSDAIDAGNSNKRKPTLFDLLPEKTVEQIRPVIAEFQEKWENENTRRKGGLNAITGDHMREFATTFSQVVTQRGFEDLRRREEKI